MGERLGVFVREVSQRAWSRWRSLTPQQRAWLAMGVIVYFGAMLRARGVLFGRTIPLWADEASWAIKLVEQPLAIDLIRPIGFSAVSKLLVRCFGAYENVLRLLPWCAGLGALLIAPLLARRALRTFGAQLLFVAIIAFHPAAIDLGKEYKPYSVALFIHLACLLVALGYRERGGTRHLVFGVALGLVGVLFSQDAVFAYPILFGSLLFDAWRARRFRHLLILGVTAVCSVALLLVLRAHMTRVLHDPDSGARYWGKKYDVFYVDGRKQGRSRLGWTAARIDDLASMVGMRRELWKGGAVSEQHIEALRGADAVLWSALCAFGLVLLVYHRRLRLGMLLLGPLCVLVVFNRFDLWPLGAFRTNLFALGYFSLLAASAFDWRRERQQSLELLPAMLVVVPMLLFARTSHSRKDSSFTAQAAFVQAARELVSLQTGSLRRVLALDSGSCAPWRYYTKYHPARERAAELERLFDPHCVKSFKGLTRVLRRALKNPHDEAYLLSSNGKQMQSVENGLPADLPVSTQKYLGRHDALVLSLKRGRHHE